MSLKVEFKAIVKEVGAIEAVKNGFQQLNILHIPETTDDFNGFKRSEQFFQVRVYSNAQTDSRFFKNEMVEKKFIFGCYVNGRRYLPQGKFDYTYYTQLQFSELKPA